MAITVTPLLTLINNCDSATGWDNGAVNPDIVREGTDSMSLKVSNTTGVVCKYDQAPTGTDMSGEHFYVWMACTSILDTKANGGLRIYAEDTSGNWIEWWVGGSDNYGGGWQRFCASSGASGDSTSGTYDPTNHRYVGVRFKTISKQAGSSPNTFWDFLHYGSGIQVTSGATDGITLEDIYTADTAAAYGVMDKKFGVYLLQGELLLGDTSTSSIDFDDSGEVLQFIDNEYVASTLYKIKIEGNATGTINVQMGSKSGDYGVGGLFVSGTQSYALDLDDSNIDLLKLYGSTFSNAGAIDLPADATDREVVSCTFIDHGLITPSSCTMEYCFSVGADDDAFTLSSTTHNITDLVVIDPTTNGFQITTAGDYSFTDVTFSGTSGSGPYDVEFTPSGTLNWSNLGASNAQYGNATGGGTINFLTSVTMTVTCKNQAGNAIEGVRVRIEKQSDGSLISNGSTSALGIYTDTYTSTTPLDVNVIARLKGYNYVSAESTIETGTGLSVPFTMLRDEAVDLP